MFYFFCIYVINFGFIANTNIGTSQKIDEIRKEIERIKDQQYLEKKKKREEKEKKEVNISNEKILIILIKGRIL